MERKATFTHSFAVYKVFFTRLGLAWPGLAWLKAFLLKYLVCVGVWTLDLRSPPSVTKLLVLVCVNISSFSHQSSYVVISTHHREIPEFGLPILIRKGDWCIYLLCQAIENVEC
ncbi:hypothetical protein Dimus_026556 [Dionaea muscipula]